MNISFRKAIREEAGIITGFQQKMAMETEGISLKQDVISNGVLAVFNDPGEGQYYNNMVIVSLLVTYEWSDWRNGNIWWFQSVFVQPEYRLKGIFRKTYEAMGMNGEHYKMYEWFRD